ncbi:RNA polymerase sigma factor [bacterium]|nr:MAG: RNA polymerase sigma factor [bacterium]
MSETPPLRASLDSFLASVERRALRIAQVATRDRDEALDLVQDAMLRLARRYAARPPHEWPPLFHRILTNRIRDWQRHRRLRARLFFWQSRSDEDESDREALLDRQPDPDAAEGAGALQGEQLLARLELALARLPPRQRETFQLRVWEGLNVESTARAMGCSGGSVKTHLFRALQSLRSELGDDFLSEGPGDE